MPAQHLPDANATLDLSEPVKCSRRVRSREVGKANITSSDARRLVERLQPLNLSQRIVGPVPRGFYMHRGDDILVGRVAAVIIDEIISSYRREIPKRLNGASGGAKPWMPVHPQIPQMNVRVYDRSAIQSGHA